MEQWDAQLFLTLARAAERRMGQFDAQGLANTVCAFAKVDRFDEQLFMSVSGVAEQRAGDFNVQKLVNIAWAFAKVAAADSRDAQLFLTLARTAKCCMGGFNND